MLSSTALKSTNANASSNTVRDLPKVFVFSGQGTQSYCMAKDLFDADRTFRRHMLDLNDRFKDVLGHSIVEHIYDPRVARALPLDNILFSHPAIFMVEYALARTLIEQGVKPNLVLGASLGELTAAAVAGALPIEQAVSLVAGHARVFARACAPGGMTAILHDAGIYDQMPTLSRLSELAAINYSAHFVVAGDSGGLDQIEGALRQREIPFLRLPVRQPFHSSLIDRIKDQFYGESPAGPFPTPALPLISCAAAAEIKTCDADHFWRVMREPIRLLETVRYLERQGSFNYIDLGPGGSFANFIKRIVDAGAASQVYQVLTPFSRGPKELDRVIADFKRLEASAQDHALTGPLTAAKTRHTPDRTKAYMFPGQGSQQPGMGASLFAQFRDLTDIADTVLGYSIRALCTDDPDKQLAKTQFTQPALYVVNALSYYKKLQEGATPPAYIVGHSLGEYNALLAAGAFSFEVGLRLVKKRGELMSQAAGGAMAAVIGCDVDAIRRILADNDLQTIDIANFNAPLQTVLSGPAADIRNARSFFVTHGAQYVPLNVGAAFHSRSMAAAARDFEAHLRQFEYSALTCTVISNVTAQPYEHAHIVRNLKDQLRESVRWTDTIGYLISLGVQEFEEVGPGKVLTKLAALIRQHELSKL